MNLNDKYKILAKANAFFDFENFWNSKTHALSDLGAAQRLLEMDKAGMIPKFIYVEDEGNPRTGEWLKYDGKVWKPACMEELKLYVDCMVSLVKDSAIAAFKARLASSKKKNKENKENKENESDDSSLDVRSKDNSSREERKIWAETVGEAERFAQKYNSQAGVKSALKAFQRLTHFVKGYKEFDADNFKINVQDGYLDLKTRILTPHSAEHKCRKVMNASFGHNDDGFYYNIFLPYINSFFPGSPDTCKYFQMLLGYCLTGDTSEQKLFFLYGSGKNGKSALMNLVLGVWGDYGGVVPTGALLSSKGDSAGEAPSPMIDRLEGMRLVLGHEIPASMRKLNEEKVKTLTGDAVITTRTLNKGGHSWLPQMKFLLDLNDLPEVSDPTAVSLRRRLRAIPFNARFEGNSSFMHLERDERFRNAMLRFAVEGLVMLGAGMLDDWTGEWSDAKGLPSEMFETLRQYYAESDSVTPFLTNYMKITQDSSDFVSVNRLFSYFCDEHGRVMTAKSFGMKLNKILPALGCTPVSRNEGFVKRRGWAGIRERTSADADDNDGRQEGSFSNSTGKSVIEPDLLSKS